MDSIPCESNPVITINEKNVKMLYLINVKYKLKRIMII